MDGLTSWRVVCSVGNYTIYSPLHSERGRGWGFLSRDRRPRLSAFQALCNTPLGNIPSLGEAWGGFLFPVFWRTDEGVCPYSVALSLIKGTPLSKQRRRSVDTKRAFPCNEEGVSSMWRNALFILRMSYPYWFPLDSLPSFRRSWGRLSEVWWTLIK